MTDPARRVLDICTTQGEPGTTVPVRRTLGRALYREAPVRLQVSLLDPVTFPGAIKAFAKEVCRNDLLNFGRLHFFFPDSRLALDLNTDKTLKVAALFPACPLSQPAFPCPGLPPGPGHSTWMRPSTRSLFPTLYTLQTS